MQILNVWFNLAKINFCDAFTCVGGKKKWVQLQHCERFHIMSAQNSRRMNSFQHHIVFYVIIYRNQKRSSELVLRWTERIVNWITAEKCRAGPRGKLYEVKPFTEVSMCLRAGEGGGLRERSGAGGTDSGNGVHGNSLRHVWRGGQWPHDQPADHMWVLMTEAFHPQRVHFVV